MIDRRNARELTTQFFTQFPAAFIRQQNPVDSNSTFYERHSQFNTTVYKNSVFEFENSIISKDEICTDTENSFNGLDTSFYYGSIELSKALFTTLFKASTRNQSSC